MTAPRRWRGFDPIAWLLVSAVAAASHGLLSFCVFRASLNGSGWLEKAVLCAVFAPLLLMSYLVDALGWQSMPTITSVLWAAILNSCVYGLAIGFVWCYFRAAQPKPQRSHR